MNKQTFLNLYEKQFLKNNKFCVVFETNDNLSDLKRVNQAQDIVKKLADFIFNDKEVWVCLIIWDIKLDTKNDLIKCGSH